MSRIGQGACHGGYIVAGWQIVNVVVWVPVGDTFGFMFKSGNGRNNFSGQLSNKPENPVSDL
ncbi:hypothetical protein DSCOOX_28600 [Desulfosarcina ovata subsp. ovata]|uniref:Uncharacterized protein n=1 Tax=Desulfosarcina ovata subsp. ovata TaxID=2752305 RepID=A0A5K8ACL5_9BACT|nr:hypothetical protein DSCOOX_28600 [Desulfosarcina ovata subsp. ovata]